MTRETMKRRKETAGVIRKIDAHDMAKHEPTENAKKWMKRKAYSVEDCLRKWGSRYERECCQWTRKH